MNKDLRISVSSLIIVNVFTIFLAMSNHWDAKILMMIYWCQGVIIGVFQFLKLKHLIVRTEDPLVNPLFKLGVVGEGGPKLIISMGYYGFFHIGYLMLIGLANLIQNFYIILLPVALFFANHLLSYLRNKESYKNKVINVGYVSSLPILRALPMHVIMVVALNYPLTFNKLLVFLILKMIVDVIMHIFEHKTYSN